MSHARKWWSAFIFGCVTAILTAASLCLYFVVPRLKMVWYGYDVELPVSLVLLIKLSDLMVNYFYLLVPVMIGGCVLVGCYLLGVFGSTDERSG